MSNRKRQANKIAFDEKFPGKNYNLINKRKAEKALKKAQALEQIRVNDGMIWIKDPATKSMKLVKLNKETLKA